VVGVAEAVAAAVDASRQPAEAGVADAGVVLSALASTAAGGSMNGEQEAICNLKLVVIVSLDAGVGAVSAEREVVVTRPFVLPGAGDDALQI
jgi:hypothetical protein